MPSPPQVSDRVQARRPANRLLASLSDADYASIAPGLTQIPMSLRQRLQEAQSEIRHVFFPNGGMASVTDVTSDGAMVEVAAVGDEGFVNVEAVLGADIAGRQALVQVPNGSLHTLSLADFHSAVEGSKTFRDAMHRYARGFLATVTQSASCLALHPVQERFCRWLLTAHDRVRVEQFPISHEFLAMMLGVSRPTVTIVAGTLQKAGLIQYVHGRMTIVDRTMLEASSCECYGTLRTEYKRLGL